MSDTSIRIFLEIDQEIQVQSHTSDMDFAKRIGEISDISVESDRLITDDIESDVEKKLLPLLVGSSLSLAVIISAINTTIEAVYYKPYVIEWSELEELRNNGVLVKDKDGQPIYKAVKKHLVVSPQKPTSDIEMTIDNWNTIIIHISSSAPSMEN